MDWWCIFLRDQAFKMSLPQANDSWYTPLSYQSVSILSTSLKGVPPYINCCVPLSIPQGCYEDSILLRHYQGNVDVLV